MDKIIALLIYIFETMKFVVISYYIIGLKSSNGKKKYLNGGIKYGIRFWTAGSAAAGSIGTDQ